MDRRTLTFTLALVTLSASLATAGHSDADEQALYVDWTHGHFHAGLVAVGIGAVDDGEPVPPLGVGPVNLARFDLPVNPCHRWLLVDLLYDPHEVRIEPDDGTSVAVPFELRIELFAPNGTRVVSRPIFSPGFSVLSGTVDVPGDWRLDLYLLKGANVDWSLRVRGLVAPDDGACLQGVHINEVEANPAGPDAGNEWLELVNPGPWTLDLQGWRIETRHGRTANLTFEDETVVGPGERLVVNLTGGQFLDNVDEVVALYDAVGTLLDQTDTLSDKANDARTNQRVPEVEGPWTFTTATPGAPP